MKQLYIILFVLTFLNAFAQKIPWKTDLKLSPGTKYIHVIDQYNDRDEEYFFDKKGNLDKYVSITYLQTFRSESFYEGSLLIKEEHFYDDKLSYLHKYDYEEGNLILETEIDVKENLITRQTSCCYLDGKLSSKLVVEKNGIDITEIKYNDSGSVSETKEYYGEEQLHRVITVIEDKNSAIEEICSYGGYNGVWKQKRKFIYDDNKNIIEASVHDDEANQTQRFVYIDNILKNAKYYDEKDRLCMEEFYDDKGYIVKEVRPEVGFQTAETTLFENHYNKRGDLIKTKRVLFGKMRIAKYKIKYW